MKPAIFGYIEKRIEISRCDRFLKPPFCQFDIFRVQFNPDISPFISNGFISAFWYFDGAASNSARPLSAGFMAQAPLGVTVWYGQEGRKARTFLKLTRSTGTVLPRPDGIIGICVDVEAIPQGRSVFALERISFGATLKELSES